MADVTAIIVWLMLPPLVILYCIYITLADVIAKLTVADLIATTCGRCYCHIIVVDVVTTFNCYLLKLQGIPTLIHHLVLENNLNIFLRPEEAMIEIWQKLVF